MKNKIGTIREEGEEVQVNNRVRKDREENGGATEEQKGRHGSRMGRRSKRERSNFGKKRRAGDCMRRWESSL